MHVIEALKARQPSTAAVPTSGEAASEAGQKKMV